MPTPVPLTVLTSTYMCNGVEKAVSTVCRKGETRDEFFDRHDEMLGAAEAACN